MLSLRLAEWEGEQRLSKRGVEYHARKILHVLQRRGEREKTSKLSSPTPLCQSTTGKNEKEKKEKNWGTVGGCRAIQIAQLADAAGCVCVCVCYKSSQLRTRI